MRKKEQELLAQLLEHATTFLTSQRLSQELSLSEKTVRTLIKELNETYAAVFQIEGRQGQGYLLHIHDEETFASVYQEALSEQEGVQSAADRERYILTQLLFEKQRVAARDLEKALFISSSTLSKLLTSIRTHLKSYSLVLKNEQGTLTIQGDEIAKRRFISDYFLAEQVNQSLFGYQEVAQLFDDVDVKKLYRAMVEVCREEEMQLSDFALTNLLVHLSLAVKRLKLGYRVEKLPFVDSALHQHTESISQKMIDRIALYTDVQLPSEEASYITLHLLGKGRGSYEQVSRDALVECLVHFKQLVQVNLDVREEMLLHSLQEHFSPLLLRLRNNITLDNPLYEQIASEYGELLAKTKQAFSGHALFQGYTVSDHEWAYIALHLLAAIERQEQGSNRRVLLVCATGFGSAQVLKNRIAMHFGNRLEIVDCVSVHELQDYDLSRVDFIISALDLSQYVYPRPVIVVSVLVNEADIRAIEDFLGFAYASTAQQAIEAEQQLSKLEEALEVCLSEDRFFYIEESISKEEVLSLLVASLSDTHLSDFQGQMHAQLAAREEMGTVVFSDNVAVPHPAIALSIQEEVAVAVCKSPIQWTDEAPAIQIVILISPSQLRNPNIQLLSQAVARFTQQTVAQQQVLATPTVAVFKTALTTQ